MSKRILQVNELIKSHLGEIISREVSLKVGVLITISKVETDPDLRRSKVFISVFPESEFPYVLSTLKKERGGIQKELYQLLYMKPLPSITFLSDQTESKADEVEKILKSLE